MIEETKYTVYKHTAPNGKVYIGVTKQKLNRRWRNGNGYRNNKHFSRAIRLYHWENFKHEILETGLTKEQACDLEIELIAKYDLTNPKHGYNGTEGGETNIPSKETRRKLSEANKGKHHSPETLKKMSEAHKGIHQSVEMRRKKSESLKRAYLNPELRLKNSEAHKGKHLSSETRQKISEALKGKHPSAETRKKMSEAIKGVNNPNYGKHPSAETRRKHSESEKGVNNPMYGKHHSAEARKKMSEAKEKAVICIETGILYSSCREAAKSIGVTNGAISATLHGVTKTSGGYHWKYAEA